MKRENHPLQCIFIEHEPNQIEVYPNKMFDKMKQMFGCMILHFGQYNDKKFLPHVPSQMGAAKMIALFAEISSLHSSVGFTPNHIIRLLDGHHSESR